MTDSSRMDSSFRLPPSSLRPGWQIVRFGEVAKEVKATTSDPVADGLEFYVGLEHLDPQSLRIQRKGVIAEDNPTFTRRFKPGQILFGKRRAYQKKAAVADFSGICSGDILVMEAKPGKIIPGLLPFIVQSDLFFDWAVKTSSGSLSPRTKWKSLAEFEFPMPPPARQKAILEVLEKVEDCVYACKDAMDLAVSTQIHYLTAWLQNLCAESEWVKLSSALLTKPEYGAAETAINYTEGTYRYIRVTDITASGDLDDTVKMGAPKRGNEKYFLRDDDFLIARSGNTVGKTFLYKTIMAPSAIYAGYLIRLRLDQKHILPEFFKYYCKTPMFWRWLESNARGGAQPNINAQQIGNMKIPLPLVSQQRECLSILNQFDRGVLTLSSQLKQGYEVGRKVSSGMLFGDVAGGSPII